MTLNIFHGMLSWENVIANHHLSCLEPKQIYTCVCIFLMCSYIYATLPAYDDSVSAGAAPLGFAKQVYQRQYG